MAIKLADTLAPMADFPAAMAEHIEFNDGKNLQEVLDGGIIGGVELTQAEYDALTDEEKKNGLEYRCTDSGRIYINDVLYSRKKEVELETYEEYKDLKEAGLVEEDVDYIIKGNESGVLLSDLDTNHGDSEISTYEVIETLKSDVENLIDDTNLTSTTSTVSASKVKNAVTYSFDTQSGSVRYVKFKPSITTISVVDIYGGKIEILGASKAAANPDYKTVKVVRLSYGDWGSYDATQVPSVVHTKIGELYYYPTDEYYYLKLYNYAAFTMTGLATAPEIITSLPAEESAMTLIPETDWGKIDDTSTSENSTWSSSKIKSEIEETIDFSTPILEYRATSASSTDEYTYTTTQKTMFVCFVPGLSELPEAAKDSYAYARVLLTDYNIVTCSLYVEGDNSTALGNSCILPKGTKVTINLRARNSQHPEVKAFAIN